MKSFDDIMNGKVNEGLAEKWEPMGPGINPGRIPEMLIDIMKKLDEIDKKVTKFPYGDTAP
jgi:hypothetical protein